MQLSGERYEAACDIPRDQRDIVQELEGCIERLQKSGIQVYATHRGQGYGVLWAEGSAFSTLTNAGFKAAPLTRTSVVSRNYLA